MMTNYSSGFEDGPLAAYATGFRAVLDTHGYAKHTSWQLMGLVKRLNLWLLDQELELASLDDQTLQLFLDDLHRETVWLSPTRATFTLLWEYLQTAEAIPRAKNLAEVEPPESYLLKDFKNYLLTERSLGFRSITDYARTADSFLGCLEESKRSLESMNAADILAFATDLYSKVPPLTAKRKLTGLRMFLRWAQIEGLTTRSWVDAVPSAASHTSSIQHGLMQKDVDALLATCDRETMAGRRNYAIIVLMSRLGLRAGEVSALRLTDVDWHAGQILVRGKGSYQEKLPLPQDVGSALADYLFHARRSGWGNAVFIKLHAPLGGLASAGVSDVVAVAARRAGIPDVHAHRLRHTVGTQLLRAGASLAEVGQVLRHRSPSSTAIYAKVDEVALRDLALPWPASLS